MAITSIMTGKSIRQKEVETIKIKIRMIAVIGEKPSVARDIARILGASEKQDGYLSGNGYLVTWAFGHLVGLAMPEATE